jgi:hypothetical protein
MDPATIALVVAGALAALGIKRGARRVPAPVPQAPIEASFEQSSLFPNVLGGGLRPAVTEKDDRDSDEAADVKETGLSLRARMANAAGSSQRADVAGEAPSRGGTQVTTTATKSGSGIIPIGSYGGGSGTGVLGRPRTSFGGFQGIRSR